VPFCLYEVVMSPRLHKIVYGWHPAHFGQTKRGGGWRPVVFMEHGLMNAMWMASGTLAGLRLWASKNLGKRLPVMPRSDRARGAHRGHYLFSVQIHGRLPADGAGPGCHHRGHPDAPLLAVLFIMIYPLFYMATRGTGAWDAQNLLNVVRNHTSEERAGSLEFRIQNENILSEKAREQMLFGWAGWKRAWVRDDAGETVSVPDGLWIIAYGQNGMFGLTALSLTLLLPQLLFLRRYPRATWRDPAVAALVPLSVLLGLCS
jgi:hypothetical protein